MVSSSSHLLVLGKGQGGGRILFSLVFKNSILVYHNNGKKVYSVLSQRSSFKFHLKHVFIGFLFLFFESNNSHGQDLRGRPPMLIVAQLCWAPRSSWPGELDDVSSGPCWADRSRLVSPTDLPSLGEVILRTASILSGIGESVREHLRGPFFQH